MNQVNNNVLSNLFNSFLARLICDCIKKSNIFLLHSIETQYKNNVQYYYRAKLNDLFRANEYLVNDSKKINNRSINSFVNKNNQIIQKILSNDSNIENLILQLQNNIDEIYLIYKKRGLVWRI